MVFRVLHLSSDFGLTTLRGGQSAVLSVLQVMKQAQGKSDLSKVVMPVSGRGASRTPSPEA